MLEIKIVIKEVKNKHMESNMEINTPIPDALPVFQNVFGGVVFVIGLQLGQISDPSGISVEQVLHIITNSLRLQFCKIILTRN